MFTGAASHSWCNVAVENSSGSSKADASLPNVQVLLARLQDSYDATTRLTMDVQQIGILMMNNGEETTKAQQMAKQAIDIAKELVPTSQATMDLLMKSAMENRSVDAADMMNSLKEASVPFMKLEALFKEMVMVAATKSDRLKQLKIIYKKGCIKDE